MKTTTIATLCAALAFLAACETVEGVGRDTQKLGAGVENTAEKADNNPNDDSAAEGR